MTTQEQAVSPAANFSVYPQYLDKVVTNPLEERITKLFLTLGISAKVKGYRFLREAVKIVKNDPSRIDNITKNVYDTIAKNNGTKVSNVERSIGYAIIISYNSGKLRNFNDLFGTVIFQSLEKPSASEFIALIAEKLRYEEL